MGRKRRLSAEGAFFCWKIVRVRDSPERDYIYAEVPSEGQQKSKAVLFGKSLLGAAPELGLDLSLLCRFFFVDGIDFIRGHAALVSPFRHAAFAAARYPVDAASDVSSRCAWRGVPHLAVTLANVVHILLYRAPISTFAIQSIFETTSNEAREFVTDFFSIPNALILAAVFVIPFFLLVKAVRARRSLSLSLSLSSTRIALNPLHPHCLFSRAQGAAPACLPRGIPVLHDPLPLCR